MDKELIAPCGLNCNVCSGYLAMKNDVKSQGIKNPAYCRGCLLRGRGCSINKSGGCELLMKLSVRYCFECDEFPCEHLRYIDKHYREGYRMSMIENLEYIKEYGMEKLLTKEEEKWKCPECGGVISCHNGICYSCGRNVEPQFYNLPTEPYK